MDQEMTFPNPVPRSDLPVRRSKKPRIFAAIAVVSLLVIIFLPQLLGTKIGRRLVRSYLESKFHADASVGAFHTEWFGGTTASQCWLKLADGRRIGFNTITCQASLWKLLRGHYDLGKTNVDGPFVEYMVNYGDGTDTVMRLLGITVNPAAAPKPEMLPKVSGQFTFKRGTVALARDVIDPKTLTTSSSQTRFINVQGSANIASLDTPWNFDVTADALGDVPRASPDLAAEAAQPSVGQPPDSGVSTIALSGVAKLGDNGVFDARAMHFEIIGHGANFPLASVGPIFFSSWTNDDFVQALGAKVDDLQLKLRGNDGLFRLTLEFSSPASQAHLVSDFDLTAAIPNMKLVGAGNTLRLRSGRIFDSQVLAYLNPFLADAIPATGRITLDFHSLTMPLAIERVRNGDGLFASGTMRVHGVALADADALADASQRSLLTEWLELTGQMPPDPASPRLMIEQPATPFNIAGGQISAEADTVAIGATRMTLTCAGNLQGAGAIKDLVGVRAAPKLQQLLGANAATEPATSPAPAPNAAALRSLIVDIGGPAASAHIDFAALRQSLSPALQPKVSEFIDHNVADLRSRAAAHDVQGASVDPMNP